MNSRDENEKILESLTAGNLESPFRGEESFATEVQDEWESGLVKLQNESPFQRAFESGQTVAFQGVAESQEFESAAYEQRLADAEPEPEIDYAEQESRDALYDSETSALFENVMPEPPKTKPDEVRARPSISVVDDKNQPITDGDYAFHQGSISESGTFRNGKGIAYFGKIDPTQPFVFEVRDRVCAIRYGAFINPDDDKIQYSGTRFDWTQVRDNKNADETFWPHYQKERWTARSIRRHATSRKAAALTGSCSMSTSRVVQSRSPSRCSRN